MRTMVATALLISALAGTPSAKQSALRESAALADVIVVAEVAEVGEPPGFWSGYILADQFVTYRGIEVIKGDPGGDRFDVGFYIMSSLSLVDKDKPRLSPKIFAPGKRHVLFLRALKEGDPPAKVLVTDGPGKISALDRSEFTSRPTFAPVQFIDLIPADADTVETLRNITSTK